MALTVSSSAIGANTAAGGNTISSTPLVITAADIVVIFILAESTSAGSTPSVASISDGTANVYALRNRVTYQSNATFGSGKTSAEIWWAFSSAGHTIASTALTATLTNANDSSTFIAISVSGFTGTAYQTNPWDQSAAIAAGFAVTNNGSTQTQLASSANISTVNAAALILACGGSSDNSVTVPFFSSYAVGTIGGITATDSGSSCNRRVADTNASFSAIEYHVFAATQSGISSNFASAATAGGWALMTDALSQTGGSSFDGGIGRVIYRLSKKSQRLPRF